LPLAFSAVHSGTAKSQKPKAKSQKPKAKSQKQNHRHPSQCRFRLIPKSIISRIVVDVNPLGTLPKKCSTKRIRNEICLSTERSEGELFHFPLCAAFFREPEGQRLGGAFLCLLSLAKQRK
jgi:hypothetical protein